MKKRIYLAAPLFSDAEKMFNLYLKEKLSEHFEVYLPQEDGLLMVDLANKGVPFDKASKMIFDEDINAINKSDILLIVLDGRTIDEGAAVELGYAYSVGKQCIGFSTDPRTLLPNGHNPMVTCCMDAVFSNVQELFEFYLNKKDGICHANRFNFLRFEEKKVAVNG